MIIKQEFIDVKPVFIEFDEDETKIIEALVAQENENSILIKCYQVTSMLSINGDELNIFWDRIEEILQTIDDITPTRKLLVNISNNFSDYVQFPRN